MKAPNRLLIDISGTEEECLVEYIRKDALLEWAKENRDSLGRLSYGEFIDKINSL